MWGSSYSEFVKPASTFGAAILVGRRIRCRLKLHMRTVSLPVIGTD